MDVNGNGNGCVAHVDWRAQLLEVGDILTVGLREELDAATGDEGPEHFRELAEAGYEIARLYRELAEAV
jgi:hypothetical protein